MAASFMFLGFRTLLGFDTDKTRAVCKSDGFVFHRESKVAGNLRAVGELAAEGGGEVGRMTFEFRSEENAVRHSPFIIRQEAQPAPGKSRPVQRETGVLEREGLKMGEGGFHGAGDAS